MKKIYIIDIHSTVDLITNSSTELFVCDTNKTLEIVKEILNSHEDLVGTYEEPWVFDINEYREFRKAEKKRVDEWNENSVYEGNKFHSIMGWFYDTECEEDLIYLRKHCIEDGPEKREYRYREGNENPYAERIKRMLQKYKENEQWGKGRKEVIQTIYDEIEESEEKPEWWNEPLKYYPYSNTPASYLHGKILIIGQSDNSIPYEKFDWIERTFNATSHHLG